MRARLQEDDASQYWDLVRRIERLENPAIDPVHYVGDPDDPIAPAFTNSWLNYDNSLAVPSSPRARSVGFYRWGGRVWLQGVLKSGTTGTVAFTLPVGYRPAFDSGGMLAVAGGPGGALVAPSINGNVFVSNYLTGTNVTTFAQLFGLSFRHV